MKVQVCGVMRCPKCGSPATTEQATLVNRVPGMIKCQRCGRYERTAEWLVVTSMAPDPVPVQAGG
jgi:ribosomal protein L32